jgi:hypothetical protein
MNIPKRKSVKTTFEPGNFHLANTYPLIDPIIAEMIEDWRTKKSVRSIDSPKLNAEK